MVRSLLLALPGRCSVISQNTRSSFLNVTRVCADDAIAFFDRCRVGLKADGVIFVKENICHNAAGFIVDKV